MWVASIHCQMYATFALYFAAVSGLCLLSQCKAYVELRGTFVLIFLLIFFNHSTMFLPCQKHSSPPIHSEEFNSAIPFPQDSSSPFLVGGLKLISNLQHILLPAEWFPAPVMTLSWPKTSPLSHFWTISLDYFITSLPFSIFAYSL